MRTSISPNRTQLNHLLIPHFFSPSSSSSSSSLVRSLSPSSHRRNRTFIHTHHPKWLRSATHVALLSARTSAASGSASYGGWEDFGPSDGSGRPGESTQLRKFLVSVGIDDQRHVFMFALGLVCALAISRVRVSSIVIFPACVSVFVVGFSLGLVRGGIVAEAVGSKRRSKEDVLKVYGEKWRILVDFLDELDVRVNHLMSDVRSSMESKRVGLNDLESYVQELQMISSSASNVRDNMRGSLASSGNSSGSLIENEKSNKKRKDHGQFGFLLLESMGGLFSGSLGGLKPNKIKDSMKEENLGSVVKDDAIEGAPKMASEVNHGHRSSGSYEDVVHRQKIYQGGRRTREVMENGSMSLDEEGGSTRNYVNNMRRSNYHTDSFHSLNSQYVYSKERHSYKSQSQEPRDNQLDFVDFDMKTKHVETEASIVEDQLLQKSERYYASRRSSERRKVQTYQSQVRKETMNSQDDLFFVDHRSELEGDVSSMSSPNILDDMEFDRYLTEANNLLKQAKELVRGRHDEEHAEAILYESAGLLSRAIAMKPMSLLAVGQLGNTYLLHGELKLRISRDLRTLLTSGESYFEKRVRIGGSGGHHFSSKDKIGSVLVQVCEECEELLVEAGRKYRLVLSIDGNDARALYNWGLALSFRAQLIADIGPEAAFDADKVFMAAIDKFDAMMSKGNVYTPDALFRWGVVLQQRSRLRLRNSSEKVKLLEQAKRLYEDALDMDSDNSRVREALSSCILELDYKRSL
ncbi:uncharacterized protein LOC115686673 [Syzygium oleosum]|uniref:uncharacterized protein LOC115686673 n=1 Tax=Syzygium oleosum TaxID=219896 RepID=UPI0024B8E0D4|nr:uncharacterized protein LOC115686673 [Syzygium oleosum]